VPENGSLDADPPVLGETPAEPTADAPTPSPSPTATEPPPPPTSEVEETLRAAVTAVAEAATIPPGTIGDLAGSTGDDTGAVVLTWTAPAAGSHGGAVAYALRYAPSPITTLPHWGAAKSVKLSGAPGPPGADEQVTIVGLPPGETVHFAIRAQDEAGAWSDLSVSAEAIPALPPDLGFRPDPNGYGFRNQHFDRTGAMFQQYFGRENVKHPDGTWCEGAVQFFYGSHPDISMSWKGKGYRNVARGWSCLGFSLTSLLSYLRAPQPNTGPFAMPTHPQLARQAKSPQLQDAIAYYSGVQTGLQYIESFHGRRAPCSDNPNEKVETIEHGIRDGRPVVASLNTFIGYGWHAVTPYRIHEISDLETDVYVYDSEAPGVPQVIRFRGSGGDWRWEYDFVGSLAKAGSVRGACEDIFLFPITAALEQGEPPVDFCGSGKADAGAGGASGAAGNLLARVHGGGDWLIQDRSGRQAGWVDGTVVSEIPDGLAVPQVAGAADAPRTLYLPTADYSVQAAGQTGEWFDYALFGDGRFLRMRGEAAEGSGASALTADPALGTVHVEELGRLRTFTLTLGSEVAGESRVVILSGTPPAGAGEIEVRFDGNRLTLSRPTSEDGHGSALELSLRPALAGRFRSRTVSLTPGETRTLHPFRSDGSVSQSP
jgi:hypothetical protein